MKKSLVVFSCCTRGRLKHHRKYITSKIEGSHALKECLCVSVSLPAPYPLIQHSVESASISLLPIGSASVD